MSKRKPVWFFIAKTFRYFIVLFNHRASRQQCLKIRQPKWLYVFMTRHAPFRLIHKQISVDATAVRKVRWRRKQLRNSASHETNEKQFCIDKIGIKTFLMYLNNFVPLFPSRETTTAPPRQCLTFTYTHTPRFERQSTKKYLKVFVT